MKKLINNNKYILLIIAIAIYGFLFFEVKDSFSSNNKVRFKSNSKVEVITPNIEQKLAPINYNYRNPFLNGKSKTSYSAIKATNNNRNNSNLNSKAKTINTPKNSWLPVSLKAIIRNSNKNICIVYIDSKEYLFNEMDSTIGYQVTQINANSIIISHNNEEKHITL